MLLHFAAELVGRLDSRLRGIFDKNGGFVLAKEEMPLLLDRLSADLEDAKCAIANDQERAIQGGADLVEQGASVLDLVGFAVEIDDEIMQQSAPAFGYNEASRPKQLASVGFAQTKLFETTANMLDHFAVHDQTGHVPQTDRAIGMLVGSDLAKPTGDVSQQAEGNLDRRLFEFVVEGFERDGKFAFLLGFEKPGASALPGPGQTGEEDFDEAGKREETLMTSATILIVDLVQVIGLKSPGERMKNRLGQRQPLQNLSIKPTVRAFHGQTSAAEKQTIARKYCINNTL